MKSNRTNPFKRVRSILGMLLRLGIGVTIVALLISRMEVDNLRDALLTGADNWSWLVLGVALLFAGLITCVVRWKLLLNSQGILLASKDVFQIFFVGQFFNLFMIGATGGDLVKAFLAARSAGGLKKTEAVSTVLIDRSIGLTALALFAGAMVLGRAGLFFKNESLRPIGFFIVGFAVLTATVIAILFSRHWLAHPRFAERVVLPPSAVRIEHALRRVYEAFFVCRRDPALLLKTFALSLSNHMLAVLACVAFGRGLALEMAWLDYLTYVPIMGVFGAIPITPGGLGLREGVAVVLLATVGIAKPGAVLLSLLLYFGMMVWSLFGGLLFLVRRSKADPSLAAKAECLAQQEFEIDVPAGGLEDGSGDAR